MKTRNCDHCKKEYQYKLGSSKYCSGTCRAKASVLNGAQLVRPEVVTDEESRISPAPVRASLELSPAISDQARFMIRQLEKECDRWEAAFKEEKEKKSKVKKTLEKVEKELSELKQEIAIDSATAPSGLQGIVESEGFKQLAPFIGPVLQKLGERLLVPGEGNSAQMEGAGENNSSPISGISEWFNSLSDSTKTQILSFMQFLSKQDETSVARIMAQISASGMMGYSRAM